MSKITEKTIKCPECNHTMRIMHGRYGYYYSCVCGLVHGCHQHTLEPLGVPANLETRTLRIKAHDKLDEYKKLNKLTRRKSYYQLSKLLKINMENCHIGLFDKNMCLKAINLLEREIMNWPGDKGISNQDAKVCPYCGGGAFQNAWGIKANAKCMRCGKLFLVYFFEGKMVTEKVEESEPVLLGETTIVEKTNGKKEKEVDTRGCEEKGIIDSSG